MRLIEFSSSGHSQMQSNLAHVALARYTTQQILFDRCKHHLKVFTDCCTACSNAQKGHSQISLKMSYTYH